LNRHGLVSQTGAKTKIMLDFIAIPLGHILKFIYDTIAFENYGAAIILFTVAVKSLLLPLAVKQYHSAARMGELRPRLQEIQKKYQDEPEKMNREVMEFYRENKLSPAGGCLPLLLQMPILFSLYYVISQPLKYMTGKSAAAISQLYQMIPQGPDRISNMQDLSILSYFSSHAEALKQTGGLLKQEDLLNMNFFGINLGAIPAHVFTTPFNAFIQIHNLPLLAIPVLSALTAYLSMKYSMKASPQPSQEEGNQMQSLMQKNMALTSPVMSGVIAFTVPAGLGLYWIAGNIFQMIQQLFLDRFVIKQPQNSKAKRLSVEEGKNSIE